MQYPQGAEDGELHSNSAVTLFLQRAHQVNTRLDLKNEDRAAIGRICKMVNGVPLAIELSAVWTRTLSYQEIALEMEKSLDFLSTNMCDTPERHRSMRAVLDHSWKLLTADERYVLMKLSVFRGGFTRELAEQVAGANLTHLSALVTKSLIQRIDEKRYDLHEMVRQYASSQLQLTNTQGSAYTSHLRAFIHLAETIEPKLTQNNQSRWETYRDKHEKGHPPGGLYALVADMRARGGQTQLDIYHAGRTPIAKSIKDWAEGDKSSCPKF